VPFSFTSWVVLLCRPRFALTAMLRCADLLMVNNQLAAAAKRLEEALQSGLLAPVAAYICNNRPAGLFTAATVSSPNGMGTSARRASIFQKCLPDAQLHQQQEAQHRAFNFAAAEVGAYVQAHPLHGAYAQLWHWTLRKLLYCLQRAGDWELYRVVLANLLIPTSPDGVTRILLEPASLLTDILKEFVSLSTLPTATTATTASNDSSVSLPPSQSLDEIISEPIVDSGPIPPPPPLEKEAVADETVTAEGSIELSLPESVNPSAVPSLSDAALEARSVVPEKPAAVAASSLTLPVLRLPLGCYFDVQLGMVRPRTPDAAGWEPKLAKGYEVVREEWLPVTSMQCEGGREGGYCLSVVLVSHLPGPVPVDALCVVYKRFSAETIVAQMIQDRDHGRDLPGNNANGTDTAASVLAVAEDEFVCQPVVLALPDCTTNTRGAKLILEPGAHPLCMAFASPSLGDYRLDRIVLVVGTAVFESHMLPELPVAGTSDGGRGLHSYHGAQFPQQSVHGDAQLTSAMLRDDILGSPGLAGLALLDDLDPVAPLLREDSGGRVFSAGESAALSVLKTYFQRHRIIQVLPPEDLLSLRGEVAPSVPVMQTDDAYFTAQTRPGDEVTDLRITAWGEGCAGVSSLSNSLNSPRINEEALRGVAAVAAAVGTGLGSQALSASVSASAAAALKLAQGKSPVGFVPEEQATPAAMRRRRADPLDQDEAEAMANAAAAVASLLAQQASDSQRSSRRGASGESTHNVELQLSVGAVEQWCVMSTSADGAQVVTLQSAEQGGTTPRGGGLETGAQHGLLGRIDGGVCLHVRVPFTTQPVDPTAAGEMTGEAILTVELSGTLRRAGCLIPVNVAREVRVCARPLVSMQLEPHHQCPLLGAAGSRDVLLQAAISNNTESILELTGYGIVAQGAATTAAPANAHMELTDGPTELSLVRSNGPPEGAISSAAGNVVALLPAEHYYAGLSVRCPSTAVDALLRFWFQRTPNAMHGVVHDCIYKHRVFAISHLLSNSEAGRVVGTISTEVLSVRDPVTDGSRCVQIAVIAEPTSAAVRLGRIHCCTYDLVLRLPCTEHSPAATATAVGARGCVLTYRYTDGISGAGSGTALELTLASMPSSGISELVVSMCETDAWIVVGRTKRVLSSCVLSCDIGTNNVPSAKSTNAHALDAWTEVRYALQWQLMPVLLGAQPLPPLKVSSCFADLLRCETQGSNNYMLCDGLLFLCRWCIRWQPHRLQRVLPRTMRRCDTPASCAAMMSCGWCRLRRR
jgi:hypothetical protein